MKGERTKLLWDRKSLEIKHTSYRGLFTAQPCIWLCWVHLTGVYWVSACHKRATCRSAIRLYVIVIQYDTIDGQLIDIWCANFRPMETDIAPAKIVNQYQQDMRFFGCFSGDYHTKTYKKKSSRCELEVHGRRILYVQVLNIFTALRL